MITGSTAAGNPLPPHFQYSSTATSKERERNRLEVSEHMHRILWRYIDVTTEMLPVTVGVNEKGGMDSKEFEKYIKNSIVPLFPYAQDEPGKRVILKVDSGPSRCNIGLILFLQNLGFILYPGVPNTTAVMQETDRNYGPFKTQFRTNLHKLSDYRLDFEDKVLLQPMILGLLVFGGTDPVTKEEIPVSAFERGFSNEMCLHAWT
jgi:hypothetical protein